MTSLFTSAAADVGTTVLGINQGMAEAGVLGHDCYERGDMTGAYIVRVAVTATLIGLYALSKEKPGRWEFPIDRAVRIANIFSWSIAALNAVQISGLLG